MRAGVDVPESLSPVHGVLVAALRRVGDRFRRQLDSDLPPVAELCEHVERYRGKMLRPAMAILSGLAASPEAAARFGGDGDPHGLVTEEHVTIGAVCELVHMATLVHDDVLDEADTRRRGETVNRLRGNEAAVILGDYLIAAAYHLCSTLESQRAALAIGRVSMVMCAGELLQLHHRDDYSLDEATYFEILERKTGSLIGVACELGASASTRDDRVAGALGECGRRLGVAFQIQDDLLDLLGDERVVGKSVGKDLEKGKMTLPVIHHLAACPPEQRGRSLRLIEEAASGDAGAGARLAATLEATGSVEHARRAAARLVEHAKGALAVVPDSPPKRLLLEMAGAVVDRTF